MSNLEITETTETRHIVMTTPEEMSRPGTMIARLLTALALLVVLKVCIADAVGFVINDLGVWELGLGMFVAALCGSITIVYGSAQRHRIDP